VSKIQSVLINNKKQKQSNNKFLTLKVHASSNFNTRVETIPEMW